MTLSPAEFLALPSDPDEETYVAEPFEPGAANPLESIAVSLQAIAASYGGQSTGATLAPSAPIEGIVTQEEFDELARAYDDRDAQYADVRQLVEDIYAIVKPSTSKVSLAVKAAIDAWMSPTVAEDQPEEVTVEDVARAYDVPAELVAEQGTGRTDPAPVGDLPHNHDFRTGEKPGSCACGYALPEG